MKPTYREKNLSDYFLEGSGQPLNVIKITMSHLCNGVTKMSNNITRDVLLCYSVRCSVLLRN